MAFLNASINFDKKLDEADIEASVCHAEMLANQNIIKVKEYEQIKKGLLRIKKEIKNNKIIFKKKKIVGHYISTPYSHSKDFDSKIIVNNYIDIGQGLLNLIKNISYRKK